MSRLTRGLTRRRLLGGAVGIVATGVAPARADGSGRYGSIRVDVQPLAARGGGAAARLIATVLPGKMAESFAGRVGPGQGPVLVARIDTLSLSSNVDTLRPGIDSFGNTDFMSGAGIVLAGRTVVSTTPLNVNLPASYSGSWYLPDIDQRRITSLCESFASWLSREI